MFLTMSKQTNTYLRIALVVWVVLCLIGTVCIPTIAWICIPIGMVTEMILPLQIIITVFDIEQRSKKAGSIAVIISIATIIFMMWIAFPRRGDIAVRVATECKEMISPMIYFCIGTLFMSILADAMLVQEKEENDKHEEG